MAGNVTMRKDDDAKRDDDDVLRDKVAALAERLDALVKRHEKRRDSDSVITAEQATALIELLRHHATEGEIEEGEADDDDTRKDKRRPDDDDKELPARTAADDASDDDDAKLGAAQHRHDSVLQLHGVRADRPRIGERSTTYRKRLAKRSQILLQDQHPLRRVDFNLVSDRHAFDKLEAELIEAVKQAAYDPQHNVRSGGLREVVEVDQAGRRITKFVGGLDWMNDFRSPTHRAKINRPAGRIYND